MLFTSDQLTIVLFWFIAVTWAAGGLAWLWQELQRRGGSTRPYTEADRRINDFVARENLRSHDKCRMGE